MARPHAGAVGYDQGCRMQGQRPWRWHLRAQRLQAGHLHVEVVPAKGSGGRQPRSGGSGPLEVDRKG
ncbi:hypothetical protein BHM03_00049085 [Ensete ventricosum]|nr:hypothetical protein BHM03_00049085 [Ensete ventricosum]